VKHKYLISWTNIDNIAALIGAGGLEVGKLEIELEQPMTSDLLKQSETELRNRLNKPELIIIAFSKFE
jgi:hypothetical protein